MSLTDCGTKPRRHRCPSTLVRDVGEAEVGTAPVPGVAETRPGEEEALPSSAGQDLGVSLGLCPACGTPSLGAQSSLPAQKQLWATLTRLQPGASVMLLG